MNSKDFKAWAATIHDDATVEVTRSNTYRDEWEALDPKKIRANTLSYPRIFQDVAEKDEVAHG